jgi:hypothetical protein
MWFRLLIIISMLGLTSAAGQNIGLRSTGADVRVGPYLTSTQNDPAWKEFSDDRGGFSIMLPGTPVEADGIVRLTSRWCKTAALAA